MSEKVLIGAYSEFKIGFEPDYRFFRYRLHCSYNIFTFQFSVKNYIEVLRLNVNKRSHMFTSLNTFCQVIFLKVCARTDDIVKKFTEI
jgi:hypothetical protein